MQKIVDKLADPICPRMKQGVQLRELNVVKEKVAVCIHQQQRPIADAGARDSEPWHEKKLRDQRRKLLNGSISLHNTLEELRIIVGMNGNDGEPCSLDEVLSAVLQYAVTGALITNRIELSHECIPPCFLHYRTRSNPPLNTRPGLSQRACARKKQFVGRTGFKLAAAGASRAGR
jgi:hypothetical protein